MKRKNKAAIIFKIFSVHISMGTGCWAIGSSLGLKKKKCDSSG